MSSEVGSAGVISVAAPQERAAVRSALRIALGVTFAFALAEGLGWSVTFLTPVLVLQLLAAQRRTPPRLAEALGFVVALGGPLGLVLLLAPVLLPYPALYLGAIALAVFASFYCQVGSASLNPFVALIAATAVPVLMVSSPVVARELAGLLIEAGIAATLIVWLAHAAFPEPDPAPSSGGGGADLPQPAIRARTALIDALVVVPLLALLMANTVASATVVIVSTLAIVRQGGTARGAKAAFGLMLGNLIGGAAAILSYGLLTLVPVYPFLVVLIAFAALVFGWRIATSGAMAPLFVVAFTTFLILFGAGISPFRDAGTAFTTRVLYVLLSGAYTLGMLALVEPLRTRASRPS